MSEKPMKFSDFRTNEKIAESPTPTPIQSRGDPLQIKLINKALNCVAAIFTVICHINRARMKHMPWINPSINHSSELPNHHMSPVNMPENIC
jgi:hypothetical protein